MTHLMAFSTLVATLSVAAPAFAQTPPVAADGHRIQQTMQSFQQRIRHGVRTGKLTAAELRVLRSRMTALRTEIRRLHQGRTRPTVEQRRHLHRQLRLTSRAIYRAKVNR